MEKQESVRRGLRSHTAVSEGTLPGVEKLRHVSDRRYSRCTLVKKGEIKIQSKKLWLRWCLESGLGRDGGPGLELAFSGTLVGNSRQLFPVNYVIVCCGAPQWVGLASEAASWLQQTL